MINVKDEVYQALLDVEIEDKKVSDLYPREWTNKYHIQYTEEQNNVFEWTDDKESKAKLRYRIHIWADGSTSEMAVAVDAKVSALGLHRTSCQDTDDPSGKRHKVMVYEGIIDVETEFVYWND